MEVRFPTVDIIIPTLNCAKILDLCLRKISSQVYSGHYRIIIVDGGSLDGTIKIAQKYTKEIFVIPGMYATGLNGAKHFGELNSNADLIWHVDSDNILSDELVLEKLVEPFVEDKTINISIPTTAVDPFDNLLSKWMSKRETFFVEEMKKKSKFVGNYYVIDDMFYGLTNCTIVKRDVLEKVGGYDSDIRTLLRIRKQNLSKGAIVESAKFYHIQFDSWVMFGKKWLKRAKKFSKMSKIELGTYFVEYPPSSIADKQLKTSTVNDIFGSIKLSFRNSILESDLLWLFGIFYFALIIGVVILHPLTTYRLWKKFF